MGGSGAPELSHLGDGEARALGRLTLASRFARSVFRRPPALVTAATVVCMGVAVLALLTYWGARTFTSRAADERAAEEAASFAMHSSLLATGDAFNGYLQILRYSEDSTVRARDASAEARRDAMQQLLWLNTNKMDSLAIVDRSGLVLQATDASIRNVRASTAFDESRANLGPANSDIVLPEAGARGYVEYSAPLRDVDGTVWGFLYARAEPQVLWRDTLNATIDGGHNVIINSEGLFSAGVPDEMLKQPWRGSPLDNGSVRADIAGEATICGLGAIGKDTQIDHGWFVASCLPASLIQVEAGRALGNQGQITIAGAVLVIVLSIGLLRIALGGSPVPAPAPASDAELDAPDEVEARLDDEPMLETLAIEEPAALDVPAVAATLPSEAPPAAPAVVVVADVDALNLVEAYERRNANLAERLRESIQARLMIATARAEEAYKLVETDPDRALALHHGAIEELQSIREQELRTIGQELHPGLVRLGLPSALRSLIKEFEGQIVINLGMDGNVDGASSRGGRITIDARLRLILYRIVRDAVRAACEAGAKQVSVAFARDGLELTVAVGADLDAGAETPVEALAALGIALEAFGGTLTIDTRERLAVAARVIAPHVEQPEPEVTPDEGVEQPDAADFAALPLPELSAMVEDDDASTVAAASASAFEPRTDANVHVFELAEGEPRVIDATGTPEARQVALPSIATTFRLPDDEPVVVPAQATSDADEGAEGDEDLPKVVQIASASELPEPPPATDDDDSDADADSDIDASDAVADPPQSPREDESAA